MYEGKIILILKNAGKGRQSLHILNITRIREKLISYIKLDHMFH